MRRRALFWIPVVILAGLIIFLFCRVLIPRGTPSQGSLLDSLLSFTCKATISYNGLEAEADVTRSLDVSLNFKGLRLDVEPSSFLASSLASALVDAFDTALRDENFSAKKKDGAVEYTAKGQTGGFTLRLDEKTGAPLSLTVPSLDLTCNFSDYTRK